MKKQLKNLPERIEPGETVAGVEICPPGDWPNGKIVQHCDGAAFSRIVEAWEAAGRKEILCDFEHASEVDKVDSDTRAAAWISNLAVGEDGALVGDFKFTEEGAKAVTGRSLRFLSPVFVPDAAGNIASLRSVALTNRPNIPVAPILNKEPQANQTVEEQPKEPPEMDKLKELLGLAPEATEEDVLAAVAKLKEQNAALNKEKEEAEAESFAEEHKAVCNKEALKSAYLMNKEAAKALVGGIAKPEVPAPQKLLNKETVATPSIAKSAGGDDARAKLASLPPAERGKYFAEHQSEF